MTLTEAAELRGHLVRGTLTPEVLSGFGLTRLSPAQVQRDAGLILDAPRTEAQTFGPVDQPDWRRVAALLSRAPEGPAEPAKPAEPQPEPLALGALGALAFDPEATLDAEEARSLLAALELGTGALELCSDWLAAQHRPGAPRERRPDWSDPMTGLCSALGAAAPNVGSGATGTVIITLIPSVKGLSPEEARGQRAPLHTRASVALLGRLSPQGRAALGRWRPDQALRPEDTTSGGHS